MIFLKTLIQHFKKEDSLPSLRRRQIQVLNHVCLLDLVVRLSGYLQKAKALAFM